MKQLIIIISFIISFSYCAISQERNDSVSTKRGYYFGLTFDYNLLRTNQLIQERLVQEWFGFDTEPYYHVVPILSSKSFFVMGTYVPFVALTSLHNLSKDWDIGFKIGFFMTDDKAWGDKAPFGVTGTVSPQSRVWSSLLIATYGYYYPFEDRYFIRFGLENNIYFNPEFFGPDFNPKGRPYWWLIYYDKRNFRTSLSLGLGYNRNNTYLLNIGISIPFYNVYGYHNYLGRDELILVHPVPAKLYYTLSGGFTWLIL